MEVEKSVLVTVCGRNRIVKFCSTNSSPPSDKCILSTAVKAAFKDVLPAEQDFFLQMKSDDWGGAFVEMEENQVVPDKAMVEVVAVKHIAKEVCDTS